MRSLATISMLRITFFSILTSWESFLARSGPKAPPALRRRAWPGSSATVVLEVLPATDACSCSYRDSGRGLPKLPLPKRRPDLVEEGGGGGFCGGQKAARFAQQVAEGNYLELRRSGSARLAHGVRAMHLGCGWVGETVSAWCGLGDRRGGDAGEYL